jgi:hypothetical protein
VGALAVAWSFWLCINDKVFYDKNSSIIAGHLPVYSFAPFMVATSAFGGSQPLYKGVFMVREYGQ